MKAKVIILTLDSTGNPLYVFLPIEAMAVYTNETATELCMPSGDSYDVKETPEEILRIIAELPE